MTCFTFKKGKWHTHNTHFILGNLFFKVLNKQNLHAEGDISARKCHGGATQFWTHPFQIANFGFLHLRFIWNELVINDPFNFIILSMEVEGQKMVADHHGILHMEFIKRSMFISHVFLMDSIWGRSKIGCSHMGGPLVTGSGARAYVVVDGLEAESQSSVGWQNTWWSQQFLEGWTPARFFFFSKTCYSYPLVN